MSKLNMRLATLEDSRRLLDWANAKDNLRWKKKTKKLIELEEHEKWFNLRLQDENTLIWIVTLDGLPVGQVRFQKVSSNVEIDIYLEPNMRGKGLASKVLKHSMKTYRRIHNSVNFFALVHKENLNSKNLFMRNGFTSCQCKDTDWWKFEKTP